jgi:hypothetical protein
MAYTDLSPLEMEFAFVARYSEIMEIKRRQSITAGRMEEADDCFPKYALAFWRADALAQGLGYEDIQVAKTAIKRSMNR